jgi:hypothetical protein
LATRRSAREGAIRAATTAADGARVAGGKAIDRVVVQLLAVLGLVAAQKAGLANADITRGLLFTVLFAWLAILVGLLLVDFPSISSGLQSFEEDLEQYRDTLGEDDIAAIKGLDSIDSARRALTKSKRVSLAVMGFAAIATILALLIV